MSNNAQPWTTADIPSQTGKLAVVTGGNSGIGLEAAKELAVAGAEVILATRSAENGEAAVAEIRRAAPTATVSREALDLSSLDSVHDFTDGRVADGRPIDLLINNAGIMLIPSRTLTADGFEMQLGTNFIGHFALTARLLDLVRAAPSPRIVTVSSGAANSGEIFFDDLQLESSYKAWRAYCQSKLATMLHALELDRRSTAEGWGITSTVCHPGFARTNLQTTGPRHGKSENAFSLTSFAQHIPGMSQDAAGGALPTLRAATDPAALGGQYFGPSKRFNMVGPPVLNKLPKTAQDPAVWTRLWDVAEQLTGVNANPVSAAPPAA
jgi:NAD(P)-dependent dehydrogenase (short-subunit alcohol dehydrogenase family)